MEKKSSSVPPSDYESINKLHKHSKIHIPFKTADVKCETSYFATSLWSKKRHDFSWLILLIPHYVIISQMGSSAKSSGETATAWQEKIKERNVQMGLDCRLRFPIFAGRFLAFSNVAF